VTDSGNWQPPAAHPTGQTPPVSPWAPPAPAAGTQPAPSVTGANTQWRPPPKPGLIPLQPLSFGTILGSSFRVMRRNPGPTLGLSLLTYGLTTLAALFIYGYFYLQILDRAMMAETQSDEDLIAIGGLFGMLFISVVPFALSLVASAIMQGLISLEVARGTLGERLKAGGLWRLAKGRIAPLIGWSFLIFGAILIGSVIAVVLLSFTIGILAASGNAALAGVLGVFLAIVIVLGFLVATAWLGTKTSLVPSILMLERIRLFPAIARSWRLTNGYFWRTFGTVLLVNVILSVASQIVSVPILFIAQFASLLLNPNGDVESFTAMFGVVFLASSIVSVIFGAVSLVAISSTISLIYIDIRMRKEALDLELMQYIEHKHGTAPGIDNPFLPRTGVGMPTAAEGSPWA
jgi:hypothetical protein